MSKLEILECTLRDGSYPIDYQFTAEDTAVIAAGLEAAGFRKIEVGHGLGLGASTPETGVAAATDEEYLEAAASALSEAKFGTFFIPGIADESHLELAAKHNMGFVRIGTDITESENAEKYIKYAKSLGLEVSSNLMKTYALSPEEAMRRAIAVDHWGADIIAIVDSAGGMLPQEIVEYVRLFKENVSAKIGFHGHNNFQLAIANALTAIEAGATVIDTSLRGMGRSAGNAQTEVLIMILKKMGVELGIDIRKTMDLSERLVAPLVKEHGVDDIAVTSGYALFHSSYLKTIYNVAQKMNVDPRDLIIRVSEIEKVKVTDGLVTKVAEEIKQERKLEQQPHRYWDFSIRLYERMNKDQMHITQIVQEVVQEMRTIAAKTGKSTVFTIAKSPKPDASPPAFPFVRSNQSCIIGNAEVSTVDEALQIAKAVDGLVDVVLVDADRGAGEFSDMCEKVKDVIAKSRFLTYKDVDALIKAADGFLAQIVPDINECQIGICGASELGWKLAMKLAQRGSKVVIFDETTCAADVVTGLNCLLGKVSLHPVIGTVSPIEVATGSNVLIGATPREPIITVQMIDSVRPSTVVLDMGIGSLFPEAIEKGIQKGLSLYRLDMRAGLSAEIVNVLETVHLTDNVVGRGEIAGVPVVAGGIIGKRGDVVLDAITSPTRIIGVADGRGNLLPGPQEGQFRQRLRDVKKALVEAKLAW